MVKVVLADSAIQFAIQIVGLGCVNINVIKVYRIWINLIQYHITIVSNGR